MIRYLLCLPALAFTLFLSAQPQRTILSLRFEGEQATQRSPVYSVPLTDAEPFLAYFLKWEGVVEDLQIRFSPDGENWAGWQAMPPDEHSPELPVSILGMTDAAQRFFQLQAHSVEGHPFGLECHFYSPGKSDPAILPGTAGTSSSRACDTLMPAYINRQEWCPNGQCPENPEPAYAEVTHLVIHHSAGSNQSNDWPAVVRSIWDFHVNGRGWADIGYNWLVDPQGHIYEGRSNDAIGAHFCGNNTGTVGFCMLGDFTEVLPQEAAVDSLIKLLKWKVCSYGIDPLAEVYHASSEKLLPTVIGHRDGCSTACPGDLFYPELSGIRNILAENITTRIPEIDGAKNIRVFPNPAGRQFQLDFPESLPLPVYGLLFDLQGQAAFRFSVSATGPSTIDLPANLTSGSYLLTFWKNGGLLASRRLIIR